MNVKYFLGIMTVIGFLALGGCATEQTAEPVEVKKTQSAENAYLEAYQAFQETDYMRAAELFEKIETQYPYSIWAERAQIMSAYSFYRKNEYDEAVLALERFIQLHPGNRNTPYAYYLMGLCYFEQMSDSAREQSMTEKAQDTFNELIARYPNTVYATDALSKMDEMKNHLAAREMVVGRYYQKKKDYIPAINRFKDVIQNHTQTNQVPEAYYRLIVCYYTLGMEPAMKQMMTEMTEKYPDNQWTQKAKKAVKL